MVVMENTLQQDIYRLVHPGTLTHGVPAKPPMLDPLLGVGYSCAYWIDHVCETDKDNLPTSGHYQLVNIFKQHIARSKKSIRMRDSIEVLFCHHFLHWLEALSLLSIVVSGVLSLTMLRTIVIVGSNSEIV
jgi:hypothetical protein